MSCEYEKVYAQCGAHFLKPVVEKGEEYCRGCMRVFKKDELVQNKVLTQLDDIEFACIECMKTGKVSCCKQCNTFILSSTHMPDIFANFFTGDDDYCKTCQPPITFVFTKNDSPHSTTTIPVKVPKDKERRTTTDYFIGEVAKYLKISPNKIKIEGLRSNAMICPAEYKKKQREFKFSVMK